MAYWLESEARTTLGNRSQAKSTYNNLKKWLKLSKNETKVWEHINCQTYVNEKQQAKWLVRTMGG